MHIGIILLTVPLVSLLFWYYYILLLLEKVIYVFLLPPTPTWILYMYICTGN